MPTRHEKIKQTEQQRTQAQRRRRILTGVGVVIALILVAVLGITLANAMLVFPSPIPAGPIAQSQCRPVQNFPSQGGTHISPGESHPPYNSNPPTSGWHWANPQDWGIYTTPQVQDQLVHNLEHGGIVIQYRDLQPTDVQRLTTFVQHDRIHMILAPYPDLPTGANIALTAWMHLQLCNGVNENTLSLFVAAYRDKGPELVP